MNYKTLTATLLLSCLPLFSQPLLAADKPAAKPATTVTAAKESGKVNLNTASINELTALKGIGEKKADAFGEQFMAAIEEFESEHARDGA